MGSTGGQRWGDRLYLRSTQLCRSTPSTDLWRVLNSRFDDVNYRMRTNTQHLPTRECSAGSEATHTGC